MTTFFEVRNPKGKRIWIAAREDKHERRVFVWLANSGNWVWNYAVQEEFYALDPDMEFTEITPEEATQRLATWPPLAPGWILDELLMADIATREQLDRSGSELSHGDDRTERPFLQHNTQNAEAGSEGRAASEESVPVMVTKLREVLGSPLLAYICNVRSTRLVSEWASGDRAPAKHVVDRLRIAYEITSVLREGYSESAVSSWFMAMNPSLDDMGPARVLRERDPGRTSPTLMKAAKLYLLDL